MGSAALKPSAAVSRLLRNRRLEMKLSLNDVSMRMADRGEPLPRSTLLRIERGKLDPGVRRLLLLLDVYQIPAHLLADLAALEEHAVEEPEEKDLEILHRKGVQALKSGNTAQALAYVFAVRKQARKDEKSKLLRQKITISFASAAKDLGKFKLARQLVEDVLCDKPGPGVSVQALVLASSLWRAEGSLEIALALIRHAASLADADDHQQQAWITHQEAKLLLEDGDLEGASKAVAQAVKLYRKLGDGDGEARASIINLQILEAREGCEAAINCARKVIRTAKKHGHDLPLASGYLAYGRLLSQSGSPEKAILELRKALAHAVLLDNKFVEFHAHYNLWKAHEQLGDRDRMRFEFQSLSHFLKFIDASSKEAREVKAMLEQEDMASRRGRRKRGRPTA